MEVDVFNEFYKISKGQEVMDKKLDDIRDMLLELFEEEGAEDAKDQTKKLKEDEGDLEEVEEESEIKIESNVRKRE